MKKKVFVKDKILFYTYMLKKRTKTLYLKVISSTLRIARFEHPRIHHHSNETNWRWLSIFQYTFMVVLYEQVMSWAQSAEEVTAD